MDELIFTPSAVLDLLLQIDELKDKTISLSELPDGNIQLEIGDSVYGIEKQSADEVTVEEDTVEEISDINQDAYQSLEESGSVTLGEPVGSGILKQIVKTLAVGGLVRLGVNALKK